MSNDAPKKPSKFRSCKNMLLTIIITATIATLVTALVVGIGIFLWQDSRCEKQKERAVNDAKEELQQQIQDLRDEISDLRSSSDSSDSSSDTEDEDTDDSEEAAVQKGYIKGSLGYPSEYIPAMKVCAQNLSTGVTKCKATNQNQLEYQMELSIGDYYVYAILNEEVTGSDFQDYKAYYSEFVTCGMSVDCDSHDPIKVTVENGKTTTDVDPIDWYNV